MAGRLEGGAEKPWTAWGKPLESDLAGEWSPEIS